MSLHAITKVQALADEDVFRLSLDPANSPVAETDRGITAKYLKYEPFDIRLFADASALAVDATAGLQDAGDEVQKVFVPEGSWNISSVNWSGEVVLVLADGAVLKHEDQASTHLITATDRLFISGGFLDGNKANQTGRYDMINASGAELIVDNVRFRNSVLSAININGVSEMTRIVGCKFTGMAEHSGVSGGSTKCIDLNAAADQVEISGNTFIGDTASTNLVAPGGIFCSGQSQSVRITGNYFEKIGQNVAGLALISPIQLYTDADESVIAQNVLVDSYYSPIKAQNASNVSIANNVIQGYLGADKNSMILTGHARSFGSVVVDVAITGNTINIDGNTTDIGINVTGDSSGALSSYGVSVTGNVVDGGNEACRVEWFTDLNITGNTFRKQAGDTSRGIFVRNLDDDRAIMGVNTNMFVDAGNVFIQCDADSNNDNFSCSIGTNQFQVETGTPSYFVQIRGESGSMLERVSVTSNIGNGVCTSADYQVTWCDTVVVSDNNSTASVVGFSNSDNTLVRETGNSWQTLQTYTRSATVVETRTLDANASATAANNNAVIAQILEDLADQGFILLA